MSRLPLNSTEGAQRVARTPERNTSPVDRRYEHPISDQNIHADTNNTGAKAAPRARKSSGSVSLSGLMLLAQVIRVTMREESGVGQIEEPALMDKSPGLG